MDPELAVALAEIEEANPHWWKDLPDTYGSELLPRWNAFKWQEYVCDVVVDAVKAGNGRVIVNVPPQFGKSTLLTGILPAWYLDLNRHKAVITASASGPLSIKSGRDTRNLLRRAGVQLAKDQHAKGQWNTEEGGSMMATSIGKDLMGFGFDLALVDDLYGKWSDGQNPTYRASVIDWFQNTLYNRRRPGSTIIVLMTRFHAEDLSGWLVAEHADDWRVIRLPALAEPNDPIGREPGESLCVDLWPNEELERSRAGGTRDGWAALYQQAPSEAAEDNVYRHWSEANLDRSLELNPHLPLQIMWDFNSNPGCHIEVGQYDTITDRFAAVYEIHSPRLDVVKGMEELKKLVDGLGGFVWPRLEVFGDPSGNAVGAGYQSKHYETIRAKAAGYGWRVVIRVPAKAPRVADRVICFNEALYSVQDRRHFFVHPRCVELLKDLRNQKVDEDGVPDKTKGGHAGDAWGYGVHSQRQQIGGRTAKTGRFMVT